MPRLNDSRRSLLALEQESTLIAVIELSQSSWLVAGIVPGLERHPLKKLEPDEDALLRLLQRWRDEAARAGRTIGRLTVAFEAGRDGFWLARWLRSRDVEAYVIHPSSVPVPREHRRAKTDRLDTELLKRAFLGWLRGEPDHCSMAAVPEPDEGQPGPPRHPRLQADPAQGAGTSGGAAYTGGTAPTAEHGGRAAPRHGAPARRSRADQGDRGGTPGTA
jgi:transposase